MSDGIGHRDDREAERERDAEITNTDIGNGCGENRAPAAA